MKNYLKTGYEFAAWEVRKLLFVKLKIHARLGRLLEKPLTRYSARWLKYAMNNQLAKSDDIFMEEGILPVLDHYYQPLIDPKKHLKKSLRDDRELPGLELNTAEQLNLLSRFNFNDELTGFPLNKKEENSFYYDNGMYTSGDAEYLYNMARYFKPKKIIEVGSGFSTLMVKAALDRNKTEDTGYECVHTCIEPYEQPWLESVVANVIRTKIEEIDKTLFKELQANDILFIDSSHIIRPQGDVLFEYQEILPILNSGVIVHIHDIFTPKDYPDEWINRHLMWNEQYLLEAFLTFNTEYRIVGALNYLAHNHKEKLAAKCPIFAVQEGKEPGALWIIKN